MKRMSARFLAMSIVMLFSQSHAWADLLSATWTTDVAITPGNTIKPNATASGGVSVALPKDSTIVSTFPTGGSSNTNLAIATFTTFSSATSASPDSFGSPSSPNMTLAFTLTDNGTSHLVNFLGTIQGSLTAASSSLSETFSSTSAKFTLNGHSYTVSLVLPPGGVLSLPSPTSTQPLNLNALINVASASGTGTGGGTGGTGGTGGGVDGGPGIKGVPEPSSFVLAGLAFALAGGACMWKRYRNGAEWAAA